jgi:flavin reductase (DIM6/NTAB) family NADH-FMN oxidoreductase RutF
MNIKSADHHMLDRFRLEPALRPYIDSQSYRDTLASMATTACLVTTQLGAERLGRTVTSAFSLSVDPPAILVSIDIVSPMVDHIVKTGGFSFALLAQGQDGVADAFAGRGAPEQRFETGQWRSWKSGHPRLSGAVASMDCALLGAVETGAHVLFAGGVVDLDLIADRSPLIWHDRRYNAIAQRPRLLMKLVQLTRTRPAERNR